MNRKNLSQPLLASLIAAMLVSACGKNLHVGVPNPNGNNKNSSTGAGDGTTTTTQTTGADPLDNLTDEQRKLLLSEKVLAWAKKDSADFKGLLPFISTDKSKVALMNFKGKGNYVTGQGEDAVNFTKATMVRFGGSAQIPPKEAIDGVIGMRLILKGVRLWSPAGGPSKFTNQFVCNMDAMVCSGDDPVKNGANGAADPKKENQNKAFWDKAVFANNLFSQLSAPIVKTTLPDDQSTIYTTNVTTDQDAETIAVDLLAAMGLDKLSTSDQVDWLMKNSRPYLGAGFRKFRFVMASNIYADSGYFVVQLKINKDKLPKDFVLADQIDPVKLSKTTETTTTTTPPANNGTDPAANNQDNGEGNKSDSDTDD